MPPPAPRSLARPLAGLLFAPLIALSQGASPRRADGGDGARPSVPDALVLEALEKSQRFFDANRSGPDAGEGNVFPARKACFVRDGESVGRDLAGGYHDAGDHVKFGLPQAEAAASLALTAWAFPDALSRAGGARTRVTLRRFADYLMKTVESEERVYHQVGDPDYDHAYWGRPEDQEAQPVRRGGRPRPVYSDTGADVAGCIAAHLALVSVLFRVEDPALADRALAKARTAFAYGMTHRVTTEGRGAFGKHAYYRSGEWRDDLAFGGAALHLATGEARFLEEAEACGLPLDVVSPPHWDSTHAFAYLLLARATGKEPYRRALTRMAAAHRASVRANGLAFLADHSWGTLRHAAGMAHVAALRAREEDDPDALRFVRGQVDYVLGANEFETSFVIGAGARWPLHPHHRAAHTAPGEPRPRMLFELTGAMIGGPEHAGGDRFVWRDAVESFISSEVALDYQANCVGALAGCVHLMERARRP